MKKAKVDNSGAEAAARAQAEAQRVANNLQRNFQADLATDNVAQITQGGLEDTVTGEVGARRKRQNGGISTQLGIRV